MDFFRMNRQWTEYLNEAKIEERDESEQVIFEVSEENLETTMDWMSRTGPEGLAFPHIFGSKMRILEFLAAPAEGTIGEIISFFQESGWDINFHDGIVTKEIPHEKAPGGKKTLKRTIGKALQGLFNLRNKWQKYEVASLETGGSENFKAAKEVRDRMEFSFPAIRDRHLVGSRDYAGERTDPKLDEWMDFWNRKSQFYRENPEDAFVSQYPVIISRHPVDVMRMADWEQVASCHSPPESDFKTYEGSEFKCAMKEAQGLGLVVYTLNARQSKEFFDDKVTQESLDQLDDEEIFSDEYRDVDGLDPINRGRIRKFVYESGDGSTLLAVPETKVYGKRIPGFYELMKKWALTVQKKEISDLQKMGALVAGDMGSGGSKWKRLGGSYKDTSSDSLFNNLFDAEDWDGNARHKSTGTYEDDLVDTSDGEYQRYEEAVESLEYEAQSDLEHCGFSIEVEMDEHPYIYFSAGMSVTFSEEEREKDAEGDVVGMPQQAWDRDSDYMTLMRKLDAALEEADLYTEEVEMSERNDNLYIQISITDQDGHYASDPDGAHDFLQWVKEWDEKYDEIKTAFQDVLLDAGLLKAAPADVLRTDDLEFDHFEVDFEHDDDGGLYEVTSINAQIGTGLNPPNILAGAVDGKPGDGWKVLADYAQLGSKISWKSFAEKLFKLLDGDLKRVAAQYVQQELPLSESKEDLADSAAEAYKAIYDGFNVTMAARPHAKLDPYNNRIQRGELDPFAPEQMPIWMQMRFQVPRTLDDAAVKFAMEMIGHIDENFDDVLESADAILQQYNVAYKKYLVQRTQSDELMRDEVEMEIEQLDSLLRRYKGYVNKDFFDNRMTSFKGYKMLNDKWEEGRPMHNLMKIRREEMIQPMIKNAENAEPMMQELMELHDFWAERGRLLPDGHPAKNDIVSWVTYMRLGVEMGFQHGHSVREVGLLPPHPREWIYQAKMMKTDKAFMAHFDPDPNLRPDESHVRENLQEGRKRGIKLNIRKVLR